MKVAAAEKAGPADWATLLYNSPKECWDLKRIEALHLSLSFVCKRGKATRLLVL